jgi:hypothetical protein
MPRNTALARPRSAPSSLGRELRAASRRELATLKRELKDKHRDRMKRARSQDAKARRKKLVVAAVEVGGVAAAAGTARAYLGDKMDVGPVPLELPLAIAGHLVGGYFYPDDERGEHVHNLSNGALAVAAFEGSKRMTAWARERMSRREGATAGAAPYPVPHPGPMAHGYPVHGYPGHAALPPPPSLALPPPPMPGYAPHAVAGAATSTAADRAMAEAIRVMEEARHG